MNAIVWSVIAFVAAIIGFAVGVAVGACARKPEEISWQQGYNRGWRDGMKQMQRENKKKDGETIE